MSPRRPPAHDLTATTNLSTLSGEPVRDVSRATLAAGRSLIGTWRTLEPVVQKLIGVVQRFVDEQPLEPPDAARLLSQCATVIQKLSLASTGVLRASEGMTKLELLLEAQRGGSGRAAPGTQSAKQLATVVVEATRRMVVAGKQCPTCHVLVPLEPPPAP